MTVACTTEDKDTYKMDLFCIVMVMMLPNLIWYWQILRSLVKGLRKKAVDSDEQEVLGTKKLNSDGQQKRKRRRLRMHVCWNCQEWTTHSAYNCPHPKVEKSGNESQESKQDLAGSISKVKSLRCIALCAILCGKSKEKLPETKKRCSSLSNELREFESEEGLQESRIKISWWWEGLETHLMLQTCAMMIGNLK